MRKSGYVATSMVLFLLCVMYLITYVDRVNISTAAIEFRKELNISAADYGWIFSAFSISYALFQIVGGWIGDRFGPRLTLCLCGVVWAASTIFTGLANGFWGLVIARFVLGLGEGATFPTATSAMSNWTWKGWKGFAQGITHSFARFGNFVAPPIVAALIGVWSWRGSFVALGLISLTWVVVWALYFRNDPHEHPGISEAEIGVLPEYGTRLERGEVPWARLLPRMMPTTVVYFCYGWTLWLYLSWMPQYLQHTQNLDLKKAAFFSSAVFFAGVIGDTLGGVVSDWVYQITGNLATARRNVIVGSLLGSLVFLAPVLFVSDVVVVAACLSAAFFCLELTIGPIWSVPMDIAPKHAGTASGIMNTGSAVAAIFSPIVFGYIIEWTGNWNLPFAGSIGLLLVGAILAFWMRPELTLEQKSPEVPSAAPARAAQ
jgi:MFS family permease